MPFTCSIQPLLSRISGARSRSGGHPGPPWGNECSSRLSIASRVPVRRQGRRLKQARSSVTEPDVETQASQEDVGGVQGEQGEM